MVPSAGRSCTIFDQMDPKVSSCSILIASLMAFSTVQANGPVTWKAIATSASEGNVTVAVTGMCEPGWHIYALHLDRDDGPIPTRVRFDPSSDYVLVDSLRAPGPDVAYDPNFAMELGTYSDSVTFTATVHRQVSAAFPVRGEVEYMSCNDKTCLPPRTVPFTIEVPQEQK